MMKLGLHTAILAACSFEQVVDYAAPWVLRHWRYAAGPMRRLPADTREFPTLMWTA